MIITLYIYLFSPDSICYIIHDVCRRNKVTFCYVSCFLHSGGFSSAIVPQEGCDLPLVKIDVETVDSRARASTKHFHQILDLHPQHQAHWVGLKEQLVCVEKRTNGGMRILEFSGFYLVSIHFH